MVKICERCQLEYDDARRYTYCPHPLLMAEVDMERKIKALALFDSKKEVKCTKTGSSGHVSSVGYNGYVSLKGFPFSQQFDAMDLEIVESEVG